MPTSSPTLLLFRDELVGFAKSRVMLVLWIVMPLLAIIGYLIIPDKVLGGGMSGEKLSVTAFMALLMSSIAGTVAALMVAVDIVSERNRKVYELFVIRPLKREAILYSKFLAVFSCVTVACLIAIGMGIGVDAIRGEAPSGELVYDAVKAVTSLVGVLAISTAVGVIFGVMSRTILIAVILVLYVGQNLTVVPMLPIYFGVLPNKFWVIMALSAMITAGLIFIAGRIFRRTEF